MPYRIKVFPYNAPSYPTIVEDFSGVEKLLDTEKVSVTLTDDGPVFYDSSTKSPTNPQFPKFKGTVITGPMNLWANKRGRESGK